MASGPLLGDAGEKQKKKLYNRKNQNVSDNPNNVPQYYQQHKRQKSSQQHLATTIDDNSSQPQTIPAVSEDSSSHNLEQPGVALNSREPSNAIGVPGYVKFDNFVRINLNLRNRDEVRALKRKLSSELDQVLSLVKRLETTQSQLSKHVNRNSMRKSSEMGSVEPANPRSFRGSTVSVSENENNPGVNGEMVDKMKKAPKVNQNKKKSDALVVREKSTSMEIKKKSDAPVRREKSTPMESKKFKSCETGGGLVLDKGLSRLFKNCSNLLEKLMKHKFGWVFNKPVDVKGLGLHDYYTIVKHPMDLGTVKVRLSKKLYKSPKEFAEDVRLTFNNAILYNPKGQDVHIMAEQLLMIFEEKWTKIEAEYNFSGSSEMGNESGLPTSTSRTTPVPGAPVRTPAPAPATPVHFPVPAPSTPVHIPVPALSPQPTEARNLERLELMTMHVDPKTKIADHQAKTPVLKKLKAKDPELRDMTYEEKQRLSLNLQDLPSDKLDNVVQIIKKRNPVLSQQDDEIEVDIDSFDPETLWELDRFVNNFKKSLSENKRKAEFALQETAESDHNILDTNIERVISESAKGTEAVEKIVSTSLPVQGEKQCDNVSESSSSSGASSESRSSSSDSGSSSSSGHESEADN
ncbi:transcription factor GTE3, chloroplastic-like [Mangifera indica]|uniref:transcription factor GTE3, chloroplastic-like n=1 Tax=Mangifera indica TaxID=29780 RepID=UPI001CF944AD|nr:transcription factor GTE3, chloroplastic-like [Mangifera indica]